MAETIKISLNGLPNSSEPASVNFGPGADLLMNPNKQKKESMAASDIVLDDLTELTDEVLNKKLLSIFGIGPWSVNMFEIFCIGKLNVFSSKDAGLRQAMNNYGFVKHESEWEKYDKYAEKWSPYKTIACLHLWKTVD